MNLVEFCNSHRKWCKETGSKSCKRTQLRLAPDHGSDTCKICLADYLPKIMEFEHAEEKMLSSGISAIHYPCRISAKIDLPKKPNPTEEQIARGVEQLLTDIKTGRAEDKYSVGDQFVLGDITLELIDFNSAKTAPDDEGNRRFNCTFRILHNIFPERAFVDLKAEDTGSGYSWAKVLEWLNTSYYAELPKCLQCASEPVELEADTLVRISHETGGGSTVQDIYNPVSNTYKCKIWIPDAKELGRFYKDEGLDIFNRSLVGAYSPYAIAVYNNLGDTKNRIEYATRSFKWHESSTGEVIPCVGVITESGQLEWRNIKNNSFSITPFITLG